MDTKVNQGKNVLVRELSDLTCNCLLLNLFWVCTRLGEDPEMVKTEFKDLGGGSVLPHLLAM